MFSNASSWLPSSCSSCGWEVSPLPEIIYAKDSNGVAVINGELIRCRECSFLILDGNKRMKCAFFNAPMGRNDYCSKGKKRNYVI